MTRRTLVVWLASACMASAGRLARAGDRVPPAARLAAYFDSLQVESLWPAGVHVNWQTGEPDGVPEKMPGKHTHCSAFVAAIAMRLGVYILRPPEHGQILLANAQNEWLATEGAGQGWRPLPDAFTAQAAANAGNLVVASYHNQSDDRPGHIAFVRPSDKSVEAIAVEGPDVIQAGGHNYTRVSLVRGFAGHPRAWTNSEVRYYAHDLDMARVPVVAK
jgi:hypothetical protein